MAGVPVEASVAAILRPMWPLLPMPITTTRPRTSRIVLHRRGEALADAGLQAQHGGGFDVEGLAAPGAAPGSASKGVSELGGGLIGGDSIEAGPRVPCVACRRCPRSNSRCCTCWPRCWAWWPAARSSCRRCWATWWRAWLIGPNALALAQDSERHAPPGRVRRGVPDVRDRAGVQPAQAARHAPARVRARAAAGGADDRHRHRRRAAACATLAPPALAHGLADRAGAVGRAGHEQHRHRGQADVRAAGAGEPSTASA